MHVGQAMDASADGVKTYVTESQWTFSHMQSMHQRSIHALKLSLLLRSKGSGCVVTWDRSTVNSIQSAAVAEILAGIVVVKVAT